MYAEPCSKILLAYRQPRLLIRKRSLHGLFRRHPLRLHDGGLVLHVGLLLRRKISQRRLKARLRPQLLYAKRRSEVLLAYRESSLLVGLLRRQRCLLLNIELLLRLLESFLKPSRTDIRAQLCEISCCFRFDYALTLATKSSRTHRLCGTPLPSKLIGSFCFSYLNVDDIL